jgi:RNA recognition motif-containing protein
MNIFVGNLLFEAKEADVFKAFASFGKVSSVAIVMEKKGKKSRGFGFVEMPDGKEALAAIAGLDGKALLGRPINVAPAMPKKPKEEFSGKKNKRRPKIKSEVPVNPAQDNEVKEDPWFKQGLKRTGEYKRGRRTRSFMLRRAEAGITSAVPEKKHKKNPMRWRKNMEQPKKRSAPSK